MCLEVRTRYREASWQCVGECGNTSQLSPAVLGFSGMEVDEALWNVSYIGLDSAVKCQSSVPAGRSQPEGCASNGGSAAFLQDEYGCAERQKRRG